MCKRWLVGRAGQRETVWVTDIVGLHEAGDTFSTCWFFCCLKDPKEQAVLTRVMVTTDRC